MRHLACLFLLLLLAAGIGTRANDARHTAASYVERKTSDQSVSSSTTLTDAEGLSFFLSANETYQFDLWAPFNLAGVVSGYKFQLSLPSGVVALTETSEILNGITASLVVVRVDATVTTFSGALASAGDHILRLQGTVENGSTAGLLKLQFAQNVSDSSAITIKRGSSLIVRRVR